MMTGNMNDAVFGCPDPGKAIGLMADFSHPISAEPAGAVNLHSACRMPRAEIVFSSNRHMRRKRRQPLPSRCSARVNSFTSPPPSERPRQCRRRGAGRCINPLPTTRL